MKTGPSSINSIDFDNKTLIGLEYESRQQLDSIDPMLQALGGHAAAKDDGPREATSKSNLPSSVQSAATEQPCSDEHDFAEEIDQRYATDPDVEKFLQQKSGWKKYAETDRSIDLSVDQFWNEFLDNSARLGFEKLQELMKFWDIKIEPWSDDKRVLTLVCPVVGVPFIS